MNCFPQWPHHLPFSPARYRVPVSPHSPTTCQSSPLLLYSVVSDLYIEAILDVRWFLIVILNCISLVTNPVKYLFMSLV